MTVKPVTMEGLKKVTQSKAMKALIEAWLLQKAHTEIVSKQVDSVYADILQEIPIFEDKRYESGRAESGERIYNQDRFYLSTDESGVRQCWNEADKRLRAAGIKPDSMDSDHCPKLSAQWELTKLENRIIDESGKPFNISHTSAGMWGDTREGWLKNIIGAVIAYHGIKNPLKDGLK